MCFESSKHSHHIYQYAVLVSAVSDSCTALHT